MAPDPDELLAGLDEQQRAAVTHPAMPLVIVAGAGSGKTRVLTRRIAWRCATGDDDPRRVLALTFTRAAAAELRDRLRGLGVREAVQATTFHGCARLLLTRRCRDANRPVPVIVDDQRRLLREVAKDAGELADLETELAWARARMVSPAAYPEAARRAGRESRTGHERLADLFERYAARKRARGVVDFDDLLEQAADALETDPAWAAGQRELFRTVYVDELQDMTPLQFRLLTLLLGERRALCAVGDPNQAIYGFNGSDPRFVAEPGRFLPGVDVLRLTRTYRSTAQILQPANRTLHAWGIAATTLDVVRDDGPLPVVRAHDDETAEAHAVARLVSDRRLPGRPWSDQAVLARTRAQLGPIAEALRATGVPHRVVPSPPQADPGVARVLAVLRSSDRPYAEAVAAACATVDENEVDTPAARLVELFDEYDRVEQRPSRDGLLAWLQLVGYDSRPPGDAVVLTTFHGAKGLEWPIVHLVGLEAGLAPLVRDGTTEEMTEERRLFYVACTRAMDALTLHWARSRTVGGRVRARTMSPFLDDLQRSLADVAAASAPAPPPARLRVVAPAGPGATAAAARAEALRAWRARRARAAGVAPAAVLPDHVLRALADAGPDAADDVVAVAGTGHLVAAGLVDELLGALRGER